MNKNIKQELSEIVREATTWGKAALYSPLVMGLTGCSEQDQQYLLSAGIVGGVVLAGVGIAAYLVRGNNQEQQTYQNQTSLRATPRTEYRAEVYRPVETRATTQSPTKATSRKTTNSRTEQKNRDRTSDNTNSSGYDFTPSYIDSGSSHDSGSHGSSGHSCGGGSHSCSSGSSSCSSGSSCGGGCGGGGD